MTILPQVEPEGSFARDHQRILELNGWDNLDQEVLISTPRRFGKTISVSMFAAAMIFSVPNLECSIYSTCKRISQKLLRNIDKFLHLIYAELGIPHYRVIRCNMEEIVLKGPHSDMDVRIVNSYPSKVSDRPSVIDNIYLGLPPLGIYYYCLLPPSVVAALLCPGLGASTNGKVPVFSRATKTMVFKVLADVKMRP